MLHSNDESGDGKQMNRMRKTNRRFLWLISILFLIAVVVVSSVVLFSKTQSSTADGKIISSELIKVPGQNSKLNIYKIYYYSEGVKTEALLTEPIWSGQYPMIVDLHGGLLFGGDPSTYSIPEEITNGYSIDYVSKGSSNVITLYPQYRGYGGSEGQPQGLIGSTFDAQNAIKAATYMMGEKMQKDSLYLLGHSFGGGIALRMASERSDVKAVVAVAPYVGSDTIVRWLENNPRDVTPPAPVFREYIEDYRNESVQNNGNLLDVIPKIKAPVLFLQGTNDNWIMWQAVEQYAKDMEKADKTVKFIKYPGGQHDLLQQFPEAAQQFVNWFKEHGLTKY